MMRRSDWAVALGLAFSAATLAACGGGGDGGGSNSASGSADDARLEFAACMREHGVDMPDPQPGAELVLPTQSSPGMEEAVAACEAKLGDAGQELRQEEEGRFEEDALAFAQCMRENGVDMPDPQVGRDGGVEEARQAIWAEPNSPSFRKAQEACASKMPDESATGTAVVK